MLRSSVPVGSFCVSSDSRSLLLEAGLSPGLMTEAVWCVQASQSAQYPPQLCCCVGCGHWLAVALLTALVYSAKNGSRRGVGLGHERSYM